MMKRLLMTMFTAFLAAEISLSAETLPAITPTASFLFAERGADQLWMDVYAPAEGTAGLNLPTVLFVFGGGFKTGTRDQGYLLPFYKQLSDAGYRVVAIDYRLGLKEVTKMGIGQRDLLKKAIDMAVEDLFSATSFLLANPDATGVDPKNIVLCGSSAGAITVLQADWERCNGGALAAGLPKDFAFAGVVAFSGAVYSDRGAVRYRNAAPAPTMLLHGIDDKIVPYRKISFFNLCFAGSHYLFQVLEKSGVPCAIYRFKDIGHEVAASMAHNFPLMDRFLRANVVEKKVLVEDATMTDKAIEPWSLKSLDDIYANSGE